jgi:hypothetical protein
MRLPILAALALLAAPAPAPAHPAHPGPPDLAAYQVVDDSAYSPPTPDADGRRWWKGNLHTHSVWSDGDHFPEVIAAWYKANGYHFLSLSDHNVLSVGEKWVEPATNNFLARSGGVAALEYYQQLFGPEWVETRRDETGELLVRLKPLSEFRTLFEEPSRFLMIQAEEITDHLNVHVNATNVAELIPPQRGDSVFETIQNNVRAVLEQRGQTGQPMFPHLNHPNWQWAITAEDMMPVEDLQFFEVYNGHRGVRNNGDDTHVDLDRLWDIVLAARLGQLGLPPVYGLAVDDAHHYADSNSQTARPGRGWVMVRSRFLTPEQLIASLEAGEFYSSSGVSLSQIDRSPTGLSLQIEAEQGVEYTTHFIGTRRGYDPSSTPVTAADGTPLPVTRRYSKEVGTTLAEVKGSSPSYTFQGDELYVRAKVVSSRAKANYYVLGEREAAWVQPVIPPQPE